MPQGPQLIALSSASPVGSSQVIATSGPIAAGTAAASLPAAAGKFTYITGFDATGMGATGAGSVSITISGLSATLDYVFPVPAGATVGAAPLSVRFNPPIKASAANTAIVVTMPTLGAGNLNAAVSAYGYQI